MTDLRHVVDRTSLSQGTRDAKALIPRARASLPQFIYTLSLAFACLCLDCRKLTAEPAPAPSPRPAAIESAETLYDGGLKPGWQDYGWGTHEISTGPARINMSNYGGFILHHDPLQARYGGLSFRMLAPATFGNFLQVQVVNGDDKSLPTIDVGPERIRKLPGGWADVYISWSELNPSSAPFDRIFLHAKTNVAGTWVQFDKIVLTKFDPKTAGSAAAATASKSVSLQVNCKAPGHTISPYIYGIAGSVRDTGGTARRWGGNPVTRYNWQLGNAYNVGKDWFFENGKSGHYRDYLAENQKANLASALTVPMIGWVAKDTSSVGFPSSVYGPQRAHDPHRPEAGDGVRADGTNIQPKSASLTSVEAPPEMMQKWVEAIRAQDAKTGKRSVQLYILDNEPALWNSTHRDVHPDALTYDELLDRTIRYGTAIRNADPQALIAGPAEWGWTGYFYSAKDAEAGVSLRPDRRAHGDVPLLPWYLKQLREHDRTSGKRVLDVLDVHFYPQGNGVYSNNADPATAALRLRSTRALWDPSYKDESWIAEPVRLLPRLKEWVQQNYPGLAISIGEYNFGGEQHMSGGLAVAEALGRFGTEGIDYAFYWFEPPPNSPAYWAFRAFRNFDGKNAKFLSRSVDTKMASNVSLFASRDDSGKHMVLIALNLEPTTAAKATIAMNGCGSLVTRRKFVYSSQAPAFVEEASTTARGLDEVLAPYSINVFDVELK
ncbi:MAG TPA: glycoside hydrolase family 44 protein [Polyangiaceae bacterium]|nr:glycoside hydrolase family 44 protein [Polyangiaceae bacterium]